jgi:phosphinothricin acetyltransferase
MAMTIRDAVEEDLPAITRLLNHEITTGTASWATAERTEAAMTTWLAERARAGYPTLVAEAGRVFLGYAALGPFRQQEGFAPTAEFSVYVEPGARGGGVGATLLAAIESRARAEGFAAIVGCVGADNEGSLRLHRRHGFEEAGRLPAVGRKFGRWLDLVLLIKRL